MIASLLISLYTFFVLFMFTGFYDDLVGFKDKSFCLQMGWHKGGDEVWSDGCSAHSICPRCGKEVMQDSQGNWF